MPSAFSPWSLFLVLLLVAYVIGCRTVPVPPTRPPEPLPPEFEAISLLCERAMFATSTKRVAECPPCSEDFQSAADVLDFLLDEPLIERQDLVNALNATKLQRFEGPDGLVLITADDVFTQIPDVILKDKFGDDVTTIIHDPTPIAPEMIQPVAMACWVGLKKAKF